MESCYIPNNPQYGLSLEYTYTGGASFNGTISGYASGCSTLSDGILCCHDDLQTCGCTHLERLKHYEEHCHIRCDPEECNDNIHLEECNSEIELQNCGTRLASCERLESCNTDRVSCDNNVRDDEDHLIDRGNSLTNCDTRLVKCDNQISNYEERLTNTVDCLSDCDNRLIENNEQLRNCDEHNLVRCNDQLVQCGIRDENCNEQINITHYEESLDNCDGVIHSTDNRLIGSDRILTHTKDTYTGKCSGPLEDYKQSIRRYIDSTEDCENSLGECQSQILASVERLQDTEGQFGDCNNQLEDSNGQLVDCEEHLRECEEQLGECDEQLDGDERLVFEEYRELGPGGPGTGYWIPDEMASCSFSLPPLDLDPLPSLFPFSPCSGNYKNELKEKQPNEVADVLLSLKHAVVHPGAEIGAQYSQQELAIHPQMVMGGTGCYESCGPGVFPTMSVNVSMNMTMHGYPPEQMCPQMQWNQTSPAPMNMMYSQNQGVISSSPYPGSATYSFTADFRGPAQSDPLITATSSFKPIQITSSQKSQQGTNYNIFSQKPVQANFSAFNHTLSQKPQNLASPNYSQIKTRSTAKDNQINGASIGPTYQIIGQNQNPISPHSLGYSHINGNGNSVSAGKVHIGSLSGCSESEDEQKPNLCRICGKTYARPSTLKTHLRTHSGERPYRCSDCNKSFSQAANLTAHVRTHTGQKPFSCQICHRRFSQSSSVTTHMRTHSGERPYRCRACKKAFSDSSTLTKHLRIHSGEKPYQCKLCFLRFSQSGNLNRHMRVHGNNAALLG